jgi:hypothetical protein
MLGLKNKETEVSIAEIRKQMEELQVQLVHQLVEANRDRERLRLQIVGEVIDPAPENKDELVESIVENDDVSHLSPVSSGEIVTGVSQELLEGEDDSAASSCFLTQASPVSVSAKLSKLTPSRSVAKKVAAVDEVDYTDPSYLAHGTEALLHASLEDIHRRQQRIDDRKQLAIVGTAVKISQVPVPAEEIENLTKLRANIPGNVSVISNSYVSIRDESSRIAPAKDISRVILQNSSISNNSINISLSNSKFLSTSTISQCKLDIFRSPTIWKNRRSRKSNVNPAFQSAWERKVEGKPGRYSERFQTTADLGAHRKFNAVLTVNG